MCIAIVYEGFTSAPAERNVSDNGTRIGRSFRSSGARRCVGRREFYTFLRQEELTKAILLL